MIATLLLLAAITPNPEACARMEKKIAAIKEKSTLPADKRGGPVTFTQDEIESFFALSKVPKIPEGVSDIHFELHPGKQSATAVVDFDKYKASSKKPMNPMIDFFLHGKKNLQADGAAYFQGEGMGTYHLDQVSLDSLTVKGGTIEFLLKWFVLPRYPKAEMDKPFQLPANIQRAEVLEGKIIVYP